MRSPTLVRKVVILGAAGRDFHNFNTVFRGDPTHRVVAFTAAQIPDIAGRRYPASLAGRGYPAGIPIYDESRLEEVIRRTAADEAVFAYSDVPHSHVMHLASRVLACGADFRLLGPAATMLRARVPVVSVCAVRTGSGKSQTTRKVCELLAAAGHRVVAVRHPMPYGDLAAQAVQRFASFDDLDRQRCTIEEREEYEPHLRRGTIVYAGVDYERILRAAEREADVIVWDGGNNDFPFFRSDLQIVVADPFRPGHETSYHPGETNLRMADVVIVNKSDSAPRAAVRAVERAARAANPRAVVLRCASPITVEDGERIAGKRVLVIEDGPTLTHGEMSFGAGVVAARKYRAKALVDPRRWAAGSLRGVFRRYPHVGPLLPAMGYGPAQQREMERTIEASPCELVVIGTPIDLRRVVKFRKPAVRVTYELAEMGRPRLASLLRTAVANARRRA